MGVMAPITQNNDDNTYHECLRFKLQCAAAVQNLLRCGMWGCVHWQDLSIMHNAKLMGKGMFA